MDGEPWWVSSAALLAGAVLAVLGGYWGRRASSREAQANRKAEVFERMHRVLVEVGEAGALLYGFGRELRDLRASTRQVLADRQLDQAGVRNRLAALNAEMERLEGNAHAMRESASASLRQREAMLFPISLHIGRRSYEAFRAANRLLPDIHEVHEAREEFDRAVDAFVVEAQREIWATRSGGIRLLIWRRTGWTWKN